MKTTKSSQIGFQAAIGALIIAGSGVALAQTETIISSNESQLKEISTPQPIYPIGGWLKSVDGNVTMMFEVSEKGEIEKPCITSSSFPGFFELYALQALKASKYEHMGDPPRRVVGMEKEIYFTLDSQPRVYIQPNYPR